MAEIPFEEIVAVLMKTLTPNQHRALVKMERALAEQNADPPKRRALVKMARAFAEQNRKAKMNAKVSGKIEKTPSSGLAGAPSGSHPSAPESQYECPKCHKVIPPDEWQKHLLAEFNADEATRSKLRRRGESGGDWGGYQGGRCG